MMEVIDMVLVWSGMRRGGQWLRYLACRFYSMIPGYAASDMVCASTCRFGADFSV